MASAASEKSVSASAAAGEVEASRQSSWPALTETAATVACQVDGDAEAPAAALDADDADAFDATALAALLAAVVGSASFATGFTAPDGVSPASDVEELLRGPVDDLETARRDAAREVQPQLRAPLEGDQQVDAEGGRAQLRRQATRHVAEVGCDVEVVELDAQLAIAALGIRRRRTGRIEATAVDREHEVRLDLDLAL